MSDDVKPDRSKLIERLKKLFALGQSTNQHEAELAMAKANEIMTEHQINAADINLEESGDVVRDDMVLSDGRRSTWLASLAEASAKLYDARAFYSGHHRGPGLKLIFIGRSADILASKMTFSHLYGSWKSIIDVDVHKHRPISTQTFKRSHGIGFTVAIDSRVNELVQKRKATVAKATGRDLVVVKEAAVNEFLDRMNIKENNPVKATDSSGVSAGYGRGKAIPLHGAIEDEEIPLLEAAVA
jgi:hypothetical protein